MQILFLNLQRRSLAPSKLLKSPCDDIGDKPSKKRKLKDGDEFSPGIPISPYRAPLYPITNVNISTQHTSAHVNIYLLFFSIDCFILYFKKNFLLK